SWAFMLILAIFNGGTYYKHEQFLLAGAICVVTLCQIMMINKDMRICLTLTTSFAALIAVLSAVSFLWAVNVEQNIAAFCVNLSSLLFVLYVSDLDKTSQNTILKIIYGAAALAAFISLLSYVSGLGPGWSSRGNGSSLLRIAGPFQYANTMGIFTAVFWIVGFRWDEQAKSSWAKSAVNILQSVLLASALLTMSRGSYIVLAAGWLLYLLSHGGRKTLNHTLTSLLGAAVLSLLTVRHSGLGLFGGFVIVAMSFYIYHRYLQAPRIQAPLALVSLCSAALLLASWNTFVSRIGTISAGAHTFRDRLAYWGTGLTILKAHPFGVGSGGWQDLYPQYQSFAYINETLHNGYLQLALELGWPVLAIFIVFGCLGSYLIIKERELDIPAIAFIMLAIHAFVDFDWSFSGIWMLTLFFLCMAFPKGPVCKKIQMNGLIKKSAIAIILLLSAFNGSFVYAHQLEKAGFNAVSRDLKQAEKKLRVASYFNPWSSSTYLGLAQFKALQLHSTLSPKTGDKFRESVDCLQMAAELRPYSSPIQAEAGRCYLMLGAYQEGCLHLKKSVFLAPYQLNTYQNAAAAYFDWGVQNIQVDKKRSALCFEQVIALHKAMREKALNQPHWPYSRELLPSSDSQLALLAGKSSAYLGRYSSALMYVDQAEKNPECAEEAMALKALINAKINYQSGQQIKSTFPKAGGSFND
ncbi:MAG: O-antigen ligase family protein, partial [Candidatus Saccharibacteria bacterium]